MIKLIIFDFDGVLLDIKDIHYEALNSALAYYNKPIISKQNHIKKFDGLSTKKKLMLLYHDYGLTNDLTRDQINERKQIETVNLLKNFSNTNELIKPAIAQLKRDGFNIAICSNAILNTVELGVKKLGIENDIDFIYSNESVVNQKPFVEIYLKAMIDFKVSPKETLIIEDYYAREKAALKTGAHLLEVNSSFDVCYSKIKNFISSIKEDTRWYAKNSLNVVIPMAGLGSRFKNENYLLPKPLLEVNNKTMIENVIDNLNVDAKYSFIVQEEHCRLYGLEGILKSKVPDCNIVKINYQTDGPARSVLLLENEINNKNGLLIANCDQLLEWDRHQFFYKMIVNEYDGAITSFHKENDPKWSYVNYDENDYVVEIKEKKVISDCASTGVYYWKHGCDYVKYAKEMMLANDRTNNEFYVSHAYNYAIKDNKNILNYKINKFWSLGVPEDLAKYLIRNE